MNYFCNNTTLNKSPLDFTLFINTILQIVEQDMAYDYICENSFLTFMSDFVIILSYNYRMSFLRSHNISVQNFA